MKKNLYLLLPIFCMNYQLLIGMENSLDNDHADNLPDVSFLFTSDIKWDTYKLYSNLLDQINTAVQGGIDSLSQIKNNEKIEEIKNKVENFKESYADTTKKVEQDLYELAITHGIALFKEIDNIAQQNDIWLNNNDKILFEKVHTDFLKQCGALIEDIAEEEEEKNKKLNLLKNLLQPLEQVVYEINDILLSHTNIISEKELNQIKNLFYIYTKNIKNLTDDNNMTYATLITSALSFIKKSNNIATGKNISINQNLINSTNKICSEFININGPLVEVEENDYENNNIHHVTKRKKSAKNSKEKLFNEYINDHFSKSIFINHDQFFFPSWKDFEIWQCETLKTNASLSDNIKDLIKKYIEKKAKSINTIKAETYDLLIRKITTLLYNFPACSIQFNFVRETDKYENFVTFSKAVNHIITNHKDELCSLDPKIQDFFIKQLIKTAQLCFLKNVDYIEIIEQSLDCLLLLGDFFYGDFLYGDQFEDKNKVFHGYFNEQITKKSNYSVTIYDHIKKYNELKKELYPSTANTINHFLTQSATFHALARVSFQGLTENDLNAIKQFINQSTLENIEQRLISVYQFSLFFNQQAINNSDFIKNQNSNITKDCFLDWQEHFNQNGYFEEPVDLTIAFTKQDLLSKNSYVKEHFEKYFPPKMFINKEADLSIKVYRKQEPIITITNYLLQAYESHQKICKDHFINVKQFWQLTEDVWQPQLKYNSTIDFKTFLFDYKYLMLHYHLAESSVLNKNKELPEFAKRYKEACDTLGKLGAPDIHSHVQKLIFINWWKTLYKYKPGDTFVNYSKIENDLYEKAEYLHYECQIPTLITKYCSLLYTTFREVIKYKEGFDFFTGKSPFPEQAVGTIYLNHAWQNMRERNFDVTNYFKEKIFT